MTATQKYRHPRTGEKRKTRRPLWIDRLPLKVRSHIISARKAGRTWREISQTSARMAGRTIPIETLRRWYDLRIEQPESGSSTSREIITLLKQILSAVTA